MHLILNNQSEIKAKKPVKSRFTALFGASMDGHKKFTPVVIGTSENPSCFKAGDETILGVHYYSCKSGCMTKQIFLHWFINHLAPEIRKYYDDQTVYVFLGKCTYHPPAEILAALFPNINIWMLP